MERVITDNRALDNDTTLQKTLVCLGIKNASIRLCWYGLIKGGHSGAEPGRLSEIRSFFEIRMNLDLVTSQVANSSSNVPHRADANDIDIRTRMARGSVFLSSGFTRNRPGRRLLNT